MKCCRCPLYHYWSNESDRGEDCAIFGDGWDSPFQYEDKEGTIIGCYLDRHFIEKVDAERDEYYESMAESAVRYFETENSSEKPNNCEVKNYCDDCLYNDTCDSKEFFCACISKPTISKMEQVDKDINVRSKDEPQTGEMMTEEEFDSMLARVLTGNNEPQTERKDK